MADVVDPETRARMMAGIKGRNTKPEVELRRALHADGYRFRIHVNRLPGKPDIVLPRWKAAILVQGCFWHRHPGCRFASSPSTRVSFWTAKFEANVARDARNLTLLTQDGWRVAIVWECALREFGAKQIAKRLGEWLTCGSVQVELPARDELKSVQAADGAH